MKNLLRGAALLFALASIAANDPIATILPENYGEVVFLRQESEGVLNICLSTIRCEDWPRVVLIGGEAGSVYLKEGSHSFQVFSPEPWEPDSSSTACQSAVLQVQVKRGKKVFVEVIPEADGTKFHWTLRERKG